MSGGFFCITVAYQTTEALDDYLSDFALRGCRSLVSVRSEIASIKIRFTGVRVAELAVGRLKQYQVDRRGQGLSAATVNKELAILSAALEPRCEQRADRRRAALPDAYLAIRAELPDWGRLATATGRCPAARILRAPILDFGYYSGWRKNEILGLTRDEVDLETNRIRLHPSRSKNRETRVLPLIGFGLEAVVSALTSPGETVFHRDGGARVSGSYWHKVWSRATKAAGRPLLFHDLRRSVARRLELSGVPRKTAMAWIGHKTESIYLRYAITSEKDLLPAAEKMLRLVRPAENKVIPFSQK